jgi:signal transduction histidine kinase
MIVLLVHALPLPRLVAELTVERLQELQRFAEFGRLSANLLHDISSPLTAAILHLEDDLGGSRSLRHARRSIRVLERYIEAARQQLQQECGACNFYPRDELLEMRCVTQPLAKRHNVKLELSLPRDCNPQLVGDPVKFQRVLINLINNAVDASATHQVAAHRRVKVSASIQRQHLLISVRDWGGGIPACNLSRLFEPFYSTKLDSGRNLGLGLAIVKRYVEEDFGGHINIKTPGGGGTEFGISLPLEVKALNKPSLAASL